MDAKEILAKAAAAVSALTPPVVHTVEMTPVDYMSKYAPEQIAKALDLPAADRAGRAAILDPVAEGLILIAKAVSNDGSQLMGLPTSGPTAAEGDVVATQDRPVSQAIDAAGNNTQSFRKSDGDGSQVTTAKALKAGLAAKKDWSSDLSARIAKREQAAAEK